jgi:hypothetical protein
MATRAKGVKVESRRIQRAGRRPSAQPCTGERSQDQGSGLLQRTWAGCGADPSYKLIETSVRRVPAKSKLRAFDPRIPELEPIWHTVGYLASSDIIIAICGPLDLLWRPPTTERVATGVEALQAWRTVPMKCIDGAQ